jgi:hypothetical protein
MTSHQRARRRSIWEGFAGAVLLYGLLLILPMIGGAITNN